MADLIDPRVTALQFYTLREVQKSGDRLPYIAFEEIAGPGLQVATPAGDCRSARWQTPQGETAQIDWTLAHDTHILRFSLGLPGIQPSSAWISLNNALENMISEIQRRIDQPIPWAASHIFTANATPGAKADYLQAVARQISEEIPGLGSANVCEPTPYGWMAPFSIRAVNTDRSKPIWRRTLAWLIPQERAERVEAVFHQPLNQGLTRIELYLHKSLHHTRQHDEVRAALENSRVELQESMLVALRTVNFQNVQREEPELEKISRKLMVFLAEKTQTEVLLNSLRSNRQSFIDHLERVKLDTPAYASQAALIQRGIEQLESDLANAQAVAESSYTFQDIQRSIESNRLERAGVLLGGAAAILAGLAIFNNFLDIWNLSVEKSGLTLPVPWLRALLGSLAAVFWPLGAYQLVKRQWWWGGISLLIGVLSIILAVVFTILVNS